jgi:hypothetical protein
LKRALAIAAMVASLAACGAILGIDPGQFPVVDGATDGSTDPSTVDAESVDASIDASDHAGDPDAGTFRDDFDSLDNWTPATTNGLPTTSGGRVHFVAGSGKYQFIHKVFALTGGRNRVHVRLQASVTSSGSDVAMILAFAPPLTVPSLGLALSASGAQYLCGRPFPQSSPNEAVVGALGSDQETLEVDFTIGSSNTIACSRGTDSISVDTAQPTFSDSVDVRVGVVYTATDGGATVVADSIEVTTSTAP